MKLLLRIFKSVADKRRLEILELLSRQEKVTIYEIKENLKISSSTVCFHLKKLESVGIIDSKKVGKKVFYMINKKAKHYRFNSLLLNMIKIQRRRYENTSYK
ncbi:MAG: metalloregulator ArsR/SmtB family transcription factor [Endomicrobiia bacterium]